MKLIKRFILIILISLSYCITASAADNLFEQAKIKFEIIKLDQTSVDEVYRNTKSVY